MPHELRNAVIKNCHVDGAHHAGSKATFEMAQRSTLHPDQLTQLKQRHEAYVCGEELIYVIEDEALEGKHGADINETMMHRTRIKRSDGSAVSYPSVLDDPGLVQESKGVF